MISFYAQFWPAVAAVAVLAALSASRLATDSARWKLVSALVIAAGVALYAPSLLLRGADPRNNLLIRDLVAALLLAAGGPALAAWSAHRLQRRGIGPTWRAMTCLVLGLLWVAASPFVLLFAHCTSGDCL